MPGAVQIPRPVIEEEEKMPRVKRGVPGAKRRKRVLKRAKGYFGGRSKLHSVAVEAVEKAGGSLTVAAPAAQAE